MMLSLSRLAVTRSICVVRQSCTNFSNNIFTHALGARAEKPLLKISVPSIQPSAGLKHVGVPKLRCKHCYFVIQDERKYVLCTAKPRHLQTQKLVASKQGNMILSHATQGSAKKIRGSREMKTQASFRLDFF
uniref:Large ribosomal subunit protein bL36m n=1 Tax=Tortanus dextrilobatus TaxID=207953 RepID=A0A0U2MAJ9_9MAXI|nr:mitochondrial putative 39S ribosomal protein L36 [Tortanus dextrilobatus]